MKKIYTSCLKVFVAVCSTAMAISANAQTTLILQPGPAAAKDAYMDDLFPTTNSGSHTDFAAIAWTNGGTPVVARCLVEFDLSSLPINAKIISAKLSLFSYNSISNGSHNPLSGPNDAVLRRITSPWTENAVTWNTQPAIATLDEVVIPATSLSIQHYLNIDVTTFVIYWKANPLQNYGMMIGLVNESYYRSMIFASSDCGTASLYPKLEIAYTPNWDCVTFQPDAINGKDVFLDSKLNTSNFGSHPDFDALAWTNTGVPVTSRGLVQFDLTNIPQNSIIQKAYLSLISYNSVSNGHHNPLSGTNETIIQKVTSAWNENTVTWNTQPSSTVVGEINLPGTAWPIENFMDIDVTAFASDWYTNPNTNYGIMYKLLLEQYYRSVIFASSDHPFLNYHPKLVVCYINTTGVNENNFTANDFIVSPNPAASGFFALEFSLSNSGEASWMITDVSGKIIFVKSIGMLHAGSYRYVVPADDLNLSAGLYWVILKTGNQTRYEKLVVAGK